jgi:D-alanine-D-alanine ligase
MELVAMEKFGKVAVLLGGRSAEREVSLLSGTAVLEALRSRGVDAHGFDPAQRPLEELQRDGFQRVFIALHGRYGEDGTVQGALELLGIPYTGSGVMASALAMDKWRTKLIWQSVGIPTPGYEMLTADSDFAAVVAKRGLPLVIKPSREGSTIGLTKVVRAEQMADAYTLAAKHDPMVLAEQFISGAEITASILGDTALPLIRIEAASGLYDYHAKYFADDTRYFCPSGLPPAQEQALQALAVRAFQIVGCSGWGRVDVMLDPQGAPYLLEVNTSPGMTSHSLVPMAAKVHGLAFPDLVIQILESAHVG